MKAYNRYRNYSEKKYNKKCISYFFMKRQADRVLIPYVKKVKKKKILEVGLGYGYYTKYLVKNCNIVKGFDINPELGKDIGIEILEGQANQLREKIKEEYDCIMSFFMTEYLNNREMAQFIEQGIQLLSPGGIFVTTFILNKGLGWLYVILARVKGIKKYCYSVEEIEQMINVDENKIKIIHLNTILGIPFAALMEIQV